jgi:ankyrin repeat protein
MTSQLISTSVPDDRTPRTANIILTRELQQAIEKVDSTAVREALENGASPNSYSLTCNMKWLGERVLHQAVRKDHPGIVALLLEKKADLAIPSRTLHMTPLQSASICGLSPEVMNVLLENGANPSELSHQYGNTPLQNIEFRLSDLENRVSGDADTEIAAKIQKLKAMQTLLQKNIDSNDP